jgi:Tfp pilus assembly protein PilX
MSQQKLKRNRGSAMIITILVTSLISTMILGASRLVVNEIKLGSRYQDELVAKYAAEAGIERGLKMYKDGGAVADEIASRSLANPYLPNLQSGVPRGTATLPGIRNDTDEPLYKVSMWRLDDLEIIYDISKDQTIELNVGGLGISYLSLKVTKLLVDGDATICRTDVCTLLQVDQYRGETNLNKDPVWSKLLSGNSTVNSPSANSTSITTRCNNINNGSWGSDESFHIDAVVKTLRIRPYVLNFLPSQYLNDRPISTGSLLRSSGSKNIGSKDLYLSSFEQSDQCSYRLEITANEANDSGSDHIIPSGKLIDQGFTAIRSTGTYGDVKKTLEAKVDNKSGRAIEIFDYVIYAGKELDIR